MLRLRTERQSRKWPLRRVAGFTKIPASHLSLVERGLSPCCPAWAQRLELLFGIARETLLARVEENTAR